jgi:transmembrane sensor
MAANDGEASDEPFRTPIKALFPARWKRVGWAAAIFLLVIGGIFYFNHDKTGRQPALAAHRYKNDVKPGHNGAILHLSNGGTILLDSAGDGAVAHQGSVAAIKQNGELKYIGHTSELIYNTVTTDPGRQWQLTLPDGTKVWLNAASSIHYPVTFNGPERAVEITGEAYFEVAPDSRKPFRVSVNGMVVEVLGTHFNISAYPEDGDARTTLLEGSVKIGNTLLSPGGQASVSQDGSIKVLQGADTEKAVAWKNNLFIFSKDDIETIMRQLSRWYNVEVQYRGDLGGRHFSGIISRNDNISDVLNMLESTEKVKFLVEGTKVTVMP